MSALVCAFLHLELLLKVAENLQRLISHDLILYTLLFLEDEASIASQFAIIVASAIQRANFAELELLAVFHSLLVCTAISDSFM